MFQFKFVRSDKLTRNLEGINHNRLLILSKAIPPQQRLQNQWFAKSQLLHDLLASEDITFELAEIEQILLETNLSRSSKHILVHNLNQCLHQIYWDWTGNPNRLNLSDLSSLYTQISKATFKSEDPQLRFTLEYLQASPDHPIIIATIIAAVMPNLNVYPEHNTLLGYLTAQIFLAKSGFDLDYQLNLVQAVSRRNDETEATIKASNNFDDLTLWLELCSTRILTQLEKVASEDNQIQPSFPKLTDRQRKILDFLSNTNSHITNKKVQELFKISQITASRELAKLNTLGLISAEGAGRSIKYIKR